MQDQIDVLWAALRAANVKRGKELRDTVKYIQISSELAEFSAWLKDMEARAAEEDGALVRATPFRQRNRASSPPSCGPAYGR